MAIRAARANFDSFARDVMYTYMQLTIHPAFVSITLIDITLVVFDIFTSGKKS